MKKNLVFLMMIFLMAFMTSCTENSDDQFVEDTTEIATTRADNNGGNNYSCYNANVQYSSNCDGVYDSAINVPTATYYCCIQKLEDLAAAAEQLGLCINEEALFGGEHCQLLACSQVPPLCPSKFDPDDF